MYTLDVLLSQFLTSPLWQIDGEIMETARDYFLGL